MRNESKDGGGITPSTTPSPSSFCIHHSAFRIHPRTRAFTLLELVVVMLILTVMLAMVAPSLSGFGRGREAENAAANLVSLARWAREQAIAEGRVHRLNFDPNEGAYWVTAAYGGVFETLPVEFGRKFLLPDGVLAEWSAPVENGYPYAEFLPSGRSQPVRIRVHGQNGQFIDLASLSSAEPMKVLTPEEQQEVGSR